MRERERVRKWSERERELESGVRERENVRERERELESGVRERERT